MAFKHDISLESVEKCVDNTYIVYFEDSIIFLFQGNLELKSGRPKTGNKFFF